MDSPCEIGATESVLVPGDEAAGKKPLGPGVSIVIPVLNEAAGIAARLAGLAPFRAQGAEIIVVDGGSPDATMARAAPFCNLAIQAPRGRAAQMNAGAAQAKGDILLFLHADTRLPAEAVSLVRDALSRNSRWGRFNVRIEGRHPLLPVVAAMMNLRSRLTGIATGDQAIFVARGTFEKIGGYPDIPLMEDIALSAGLKRISAPACLRAYSITSGRRWDDKGFWRTVWLMWTLRLRYFLGADPHDLARAYGCGQRES